MIHRSVPIVIKKVSLISCPVEACVQRFRLQFSLQRHLASSHPHWQQQQVANEESWQVKCSSCSFTAPSKSALKKHTFWAHNRQATSALSCRACHRSFGSNLAWIRHQSSQTHRRKMKDKGLSISQCHLCGQLLANESCWENHLYSEHFEDLSQCHRCGRLFTNPQQLGRHVRKLPSACHGEDNPSQLLKDRGYPCSRQSCRFVAHRPLILQLHLQAVHTTISSWSCPLCPSKTFSSRSKLERHLGAHQGGSSHRCPRCHGIFLTKNSLSAHLCSSGSAQVPHLRCPMASCSYTTTKTSSLKSHWLIHKGSTMTKDKECPHCSFRCWRQSELNRHLSRKHQSISAGNKLIKNEQRLKCPHCTYWSFSRQHWQRHLRARHPASPEDDSKERYHCRLCPFSCASLDNLRKHILKTNKHPGHSIYACSSCSYKGNSRLHFKSHLASSHHTPSEAQKLVEEYFDALP